MEQSHAKHAPNPEFEIYRRKVRRLMDLAQEFIQPTIHSVETSKPNKGRNKQRRQTFNATLAVVTPPKHLQGRFKRPDPLVRCNLHLRPAKPIHEPCFAPTLVRWYWLGRAQVQIAPDEG